MKRMTEDKDGVSSWIGIIFMLAVIAVLAVSLYMMMPRDKDNDPEPWMSGDAKENIDGWIINIEGGQTDYSSEKIVMFNTSTGMSYSSSDNDYKDDDGDTLSLKEGCGCVNIVFNDNNGNNKIDEGDSFEIVWDDDGSANVDEDYIKDLYKFRIQGTSIQLSLD